MDDSYDVTTDTGKVRLLLNDVDPADFVFSNAEIAAVLELEGGHVKLAAAQLIDTNASNEVLASKVLTSRDWQTDGAKTGDALRAHAQRLREQHANAVADSDDGCFGIVEYSDGGRPEHTNAWY